MGDDNLVTDSFPALALGREKGEPGIMKLPPRAKNEPIINKEMLMTVSVQAVGIFLSVAGAFLAALASANKGSSFFYTGALGTAVKPIDIARTVAFATLICAELFRAFAARSERISVFKLGIFSNRMMNYSVGLSIFMLLAVIYIPGVNKIFDNVMISPLSWCVILPLALVPFILNELFKVIKNCLHK